MELHHELQFLSYTHSGVDVSPSNPPAAAAAAAASVTAITAIMPYTGSVAVAIASIPPAAAAAVGGAAAVLRCHHCLAADTVIIVVIVVASQVVPHLECHYRYARCCVVASAGSGTALLLASRLEVRLELLSIGSLSFFLYHVI